MRRLLPLFWILFALPSVALGTERFPPPDFTSGYKIPSPTAPLPRAEWFSYLDIAILAVFLAIASYLVMKKRSRGGIVLMMILSIVYFGFYRKGCVCPIGSIQNVAQSIAHPGMALPMVVAVFFLLPIAFAFFAGRVFCSGVCPIGAVQDVVLLRPVKVPSWLAHTLGLIPWIYLGAAVLYAATDSSFIICRYDPVVSFFRLGGGIGLLTFSFIILLIGVFIGRPYCRFMCPYGVILKLISPLAKWKVSISPDECVNCRLCEESCPFGAIKHPLPEQPKGNRLEGKRQLAAALAVFPVLIILSGWLGYRSSGILAQVNPTVRLAERFWLEENGKVKGTIDETEAFRRHGTPPAELYREALDLNRQFKVCGEAFGAWVGLVIGLKLISLCIRRRQADYQADVSACVACGRCFRYCPVERARFGSTEALEFLESLKK